MKKMWLVLCLAIISLISIPMVYAADLNSIWNTILGVGALNFLGVSSGFMLGAFVRILVWILTFTLFFAVSGFVLKFLKKNQAMVVSLVLATISAVFMPVEALLAIGAGWATLIALVLIGAPVVGFAYLLWLIPWGDAGETRGTIFLKLILCGLLLWILGAMKYHIGVIS